MDENKLYLQQATLSKVQYLLVSLLQMSYEYFDELQDEAKSRYKKKLEAVGLNECPYRLPANDWVNDPTKWPEIDYGIVAKSHGLGVRLTDFHVRVCLTSENEISSKSHGLYFLQSAN